MSLDERFAATAAKVRVMTPPADADSLELYSYYKQATVGDINTAKPGVTDIKGKAKWDAWNSKKGISQADAQEKYIAKATSLGV